MINNPFVIKGYVAKDLFCDREKETRELVSRAIGGSDSTVISPRRYGKSGLVMHALERIREDCPEFDTLYTDIYATTSLSGLIGNLSSVILSSFPERTTMGRRFMDFIKSLRPYLSFDQFTGAPQVHLDFASPAQEEGTLRSIFEMLEEAPRPIVFAIDEFQQITEYPEKNVEALLRTYTQQCHNIQFIYCGSKRRLMTALFNDATRPFYGSTESLFLDKLDRNTYRGFIESLFCANGRTIEAEALDLVLDWTRVHTYYTQRVCHNIFNTGISQITVEVVKSVCQDILERESFNYLQLREILPVQQWRFLIGLAKEQKLSQITSSSFVSKYKIGSTATSRQAAGSLEEKELILKTPTFDGVEYEVYDVFFSRWMETMF